jgi:DNA-binding IclR family transcriptional regulator
MDKNDSSLSRMLGVLDLFTDQRLEWSAEEITAALNVSLPTAYRYLRVLSEAGLLQHNHHALYTLGPRVVVFDYLIRQSDPVLNCAIPFMKDLVNQTGLDCVLSSLHGDQFLDTHREYCMAPVNLSYGRGRPRPLFQGAAPKVILAGLGAAQLHKLFDAHAREIELAGLPKDWAEFRHHFSQIRKKGYYFSGGELEENISAIAVPIHQETEGSRATMCALSLVSSKQRMEVIDLNKLTPILQRTAKEIVARL